MNDFAPSGPKLSPSKTLKTWFSVSWFTVKFAASVVGTLLTTCVLVIVADSLPDLSTTLYTIV